LFKEDSISAGLISLMDYFDQEENLELMNWCIATRDQVRSVLLFSNYGWQDLSGKTIGITDDTSTSERLLQVLLEKKFGIKARFERMKDRDYSKYAAVLLIGDEALKNLKSGLAGFDLTYDLAAEWYSWQKLPFVFAVWVVQKNLLQDKKDQIAENIGKHLSENLPQLEKISNQHGKNLGFSEKETVEYLEGFNYRLGERERETMRVFREMAAKLEPVKVGSM
jgi:chorismate dehydratase